MLLACTSRRAPAAAAAAATARVPSTLTAWAWPAGAPIQAARWCTTSAPATSRARVSGLLRSASIGSAPSADASSACSGVLTAALTRCPRAIRCLTSARPSPPEAPVTATITSWRPRLAAAAPGLAPPPRRSAASARCLCPRRGHRAGVELLEALGAERHVVRAGVGAGVRAGRGQGGLVLEEPEDRGGLALRVAGRDHDAAGRLLDEGGHGAAGVAPGDDGRARRHRLERGDALQLGRGRHQERLGRAEERELLALVDEPQERHAVLEAAASDGLTHL